MRIQTLIAGVVASAAISMVLASVPVLATETDEAQPKLMLMHNLQMVKIDDAAGVSEDITKKGGKGPNPNRYVDLFTQFEDIPNPERVLSLNDRIYFDLEEQSGIYYYWPQGYSLAHDPDLGHLFRIRYGIVTPDEESANNVAVAFTLWGGYSKGDYDLLKFLLNKYLERESLPPCTDLKALPFHSCDFTFGAATSYGVPDEQISVPVLSDIAGFMDVTLTTDEQTVEGLKVALQDIQGLTGKVKLVTASS